ncbi:MAG: GTPase HflX [Pseudomonadales bacterium]|nr:GTPase HflX [Pseudomonadales bacterium]
MFFDRPEAGRLAAVLQVTIKSGSRRTVQRGLGAAEALSDADSLAECVELARTAGLVVADRITAVRDTPDPRWFIGSGKLGEVRERLAASEADLLIVNHDLSPGQQRNLEKDLGCRVMTRTELILNIFAGRARTYEGQLQVELAQLKHAQTRLIRGWTHLDRQKGGIGLRGAGETQLEMDQRMLTERIQAAAKKLAEVAQRRQLGRKRRQRTNTLTVSMVGYTNAGKSTLFNALTTSDVLAEDKLFATLDPTMRQLQVDGVGEVVLADTVGFISHLPHSLIEAFKATLEEVAGADLLLQVIDAAADDPGAHIAEVEAVLKEIGAQDIPRLLVFNKIDALDAAHAAELVGRMQAGGNALAVSAIQGTGLEELRAAIAGQLGVGAPTEVLIPAEDGRTRALLYRLGAVMAERLQEDGTLALTLRADSALLERLRATPKVLLQQAHPVPTLSP